MLTIMETSDTPDGDWDALWESCESNTFYHSRMWAELWQTYSKKRVRPEPKTISFSDGVKVIIPFSRLSYYGGIVTRHSLAGPPAGSLPNYGNWLSTGIIRDNHITLLMEYLISNYRNLVWRLNPFDDNSKYISVNTKYSQRKSFVSYMINLSPGIDVIYSNMDQNCRNKINQGIKNKLKTREADGIDDWRNYFKIYQDTVNRWGSKALYVLNWDFFKLVAKIEKKYCTLWLTWHKNVPIAGSVCFYSHQRVLIWHSASITKFLSLRPVNYSRYQIIKDAVERGYRWIDFETAGGNKGLIHFKKSFGTEEKMSDRIITWHPVIHYAKQMIGR